MENKQMSVQDFSQNFTLNTTQMSGWVGFFFFFLHFRPLLQTLARLHVEVLELVWLWWCWSIRRPWLSHGTILKHFPSPGFGAQSVLDKRCDPNLFWREHKTKTMRAVQTGQKMWVRQTSGYQIDAPISVKIHTFIFLTNRWTHLGFF